MKENLKIEIFNKGDCCKAFELFNSLRYSYVFADELYSYASDHRVIKKAKTISFDELRELAKPREYLNSEFELVVTNQPLDGYRKIPDNANIFCLAKDGYSFFWVNGKQYYDDGRFCDSSMHNFSQWCEIHLKKILWQRENKAETVKGRFLHQEWLDLWISGCDLLFKIKSVSTWNGLSMSNALGVFNNPENEFRIKPQTIQIGSRTINKPINVKPKIKTRYFVADTGDDRKYGEWAWDDCEFDNTLLKNNVIHLTKEDAITHCEALLELMK